MTAQVFDRIRKVQPPRLYIGADGPRQGIESDRSKTEQARTIATQVDWPCDVNTLFRNNNLGCKAAVSEAITWFFRNEELGIILEDDCLPHLDFFHFCETLLRHYANNDRVAVITGNNFQNGKIRGEASYYFSKYNHCWGWASWRRAWKLYQGDIAFWPDWQKSSGWRDINPDPLERWYWKRIFNRVYKNKIDTWDYQWTASLWHHGGLTATPNVNLVSNIGFGPEASHTTSKLSEKDSHTTNSIGALKHPKEVRRYFEADTYVFYHHFEGRNIRFPRITLLLLLRILQILFRLNTRSIQK
jgi:hypothetical protein